MSRLTSIVLLLGFLATFISTSKGADKNPTPTAIVPFDPDKPLANQNPDKVYLDYATFERLWQAAKQTRKDRGEEKEAIDKAPEIASAEADIENPDTTLTSALYQAEAKENSLSINARLQLFARGEGVREFPLSFGSAAIDKIVLDDGPAAYRDGKIILPSGGHHTVDIHFDLPLKSGWRLAKWNVPQAGAAALSLTLKDSDGEPTINGGVPLVEEAEDAEKPEAARRYTASLGQATEITLALTSRIRARELAQPSLADIAARLFVTPALDRLEVDYDFTFVGGEQDTFTISFDSDVTPVGITVPDLKSWTLKDGGAGTKVLEFTLASPARDRLQVGFTGERTASEIPGRASFPKLGAGATRTTRKLALLTVPEVKLAPRPPEAFRQVPLDTDTAGTGFGFIGAFSSANAEAELAYELATGTLKQTAESEIVFQIGRGKVETFAGFQLRSPDTDLHTAIFDLPAESTVESVLGNRIADWWREDDALYLRFTGETPQVTTALVYLSREIGEEQGAQGVGSLTLRPPMPRDFDEVNGTGIIAAHAASDTLLRFDKPITQVREIAQDQAANVFEFDIVPPFERKRGFKFNDDDFEATVTLSRLDPLYDVIWTMRADVHETWTVVSAFADIEVKRSAINEVTFTLPADVPEAQIIGDQVREVTSTVEGEVRNYTVAFQNDITDQVRFEIQTEVAHQGEGKVPNLIFPGANRSERFVIVDNYSKDRLEVKAENATTATREELPYQPDFLVGASIYRVRPGWSITADLEKLETTAGNRAIALYAEHTTAIRKNGEIWMHSRYRLQNRSLQFLAVRIPEGFSPVSASVAGSLIRVDKAADSAANEILIPLIQTTPGQIAYNVELVLRQPGKATESLASLTSKLNDPELVDIPVERTTWKIYLPEGFQLKDSGGNMTEITEDDVGYARAESKLKELKKKVAATGKFNKDLSANQSSALKDLEALDKYIDLNSGRADIQELQQQVEAQRGLLNTNTAQQSLQPVPTDRDAPNKWNFNPSAIGSRQEQIDQKRSKALLGIEEKLGLNDNVILGNRKLLIDQKPQDETVDPKNDPEAAKPQKGGRGKQLDRLDANEKASGEKGKSEELQREQFKELEKENPVTGGLRQGNEALTPGSIDGILNPELQMKKPQQKYGADQQAQTLDQGFTNNARFLNQSNLPVQKPTPTDQPAQPPAVTVPAPNKPQLPGPPVDPFGPPPPNPDPAPAGPSDPFGAGGGINTGQGPGRNDDFSETVTRAGFKAEGRISLPINFPTHGEPIVFSKLKANANISIQAEEISESSGRIGALAALIIGMVLLFGIDHLRSLRKRAN